MVRSGAVRRGAVRCGTVRSSKRESMYCVPGTRSLANTEDAEEAVGMRFMG